MITPRFTAVALAALLFAPGGYAGSPMRGQLLYANFCHHCHLSEIHYRVNSDLESWGDLVHKVVVWQEEMELGWRAEEVVDVASYLNWVYYRFPDNGRQ
jgi:hypothetical protein